MLIEHGVYFSGPYRIIGFLLPGHGPENFTVYSGLKSVFGLFISCFIWNGAVLMARFQQPINKRLTILPSEAISAMGSNGMAVTGQLKHVT